MLDWLFVTIALTSMTSFSYLLENRQQQQRWQKTEITTEANRSLFFERKIQEVTTGLRPEYFRLLYNLPVQNALYIADYILSMKIEVNLSDHYRQDVIKLLCKISKYHNKKSFKEMSRSDIVSFLESFRKPEASDPLHKWIGTYNNYRIDLPIFQMVVLSIYWT